MRSKVYKLSMNRFKMIRDGEYAFMINKDTYAKLVDELKVKIYYKDNLVKGAELSLDDSIWLNNKYDECHYGKLIKPTNPILLYLWDNGYRRRNRVTVYERYVNITPYTKWKEEPLTFSLKDKLDNSVVFSIKIGLDKTNQLKKFWYMDEQKVTLEQVKNIVNQY